MRRAFALVFLLMVTFEGSMVASTKRAPLPDAVLQAKTVYIDNQSGYGETADKAYEELLKWDRYKVVTNKKEADLILRLGSSESPSSSTSTGTVIMNENGKNSPQTGTVVSNTSSSTRKITQITILDAKTTDNLWQDSRYGGYYSSAPRELIKELRKRVEEQEKQNNASK